MKRVWFYKGKRKSEREISKILNRCKTAIHNVLSKKNCMERKNDLVVKKS